MEGIQSSGMSILEMSSAKAFSSRGTHSTEIDIRWRKQNQKSCLAISLIGSFELLRFTIPIKFCASTYSTTNLPSNLCTKDYKHLHAPKSSLRVEDSTASDLEKYSRAISNASHRVTAPRKIVGVRSDSYGEAR